MDRTSQSVAVLLLAGVLLLVCFVNMLRQPERTDELLGTSPITYRIDPNQADADTLCLLPRIGPGIAQRITDDRDAKGPFTSAADMTRVKMVGDKTAAAIEPWVEFD
ncbi:MAG: helix-hairpin-helix domain-containing protein [Planctomycetota bacterium]